MLDTQRRENNIPQSSSSTINKSHQPSSSSSCTPRSAYPVTPSTCTTSNSGEDSSIHPPARHNQQAGARPEVKVKAEPEVDAASASASPAPSAPAKKKKKRGWKGWALVVEDDDGNLLEVREDGSPPPDSVPAEKSTARQRKPQSRQTSVPGEAQARSAQRPAHMVSGLRRSQKSFSPYMPVDNASAAGPSTTTKPTGRKPPRKRISNGSDSAGDVHPPAPRKRRRILSTPASDNHPPSPKSSHRDQSSPVASSSKDKLYAGSAEQHPGPRSVASSVPRTSQAPRSTASPRPDSPRPVPRPSKKGKEKETGPPPAAESHRSTSSKLPSVEARNSGNDEQSRFDTPASTTASRPGTARQTPSTSALADEVDIPDPAAQPRVGMGEQYPSPPESNIRSEALFLIQEAEKRRKQEEEEARREPPPDSVTVTPAQAAPTGRTVYSVRRPTSEHISPHHPPTTEERPSSSRSQPQLHSWQPLPGSTELVSVPSLPSSVVSPTSPIEYSRHNGYQGTYDGRSHGHTQTLNKGHHHDPDTPHAAFYEAPYNEDYGHHSRFSSAAEGKRTYPPPVRSTSTRDDARYARISSYPTPVTAQSHQFRDTLAQSSHKQTPQSHGTRSTSPQRPPRQVSPMLSNPRRQSYAPAGSHPGSNVYTPRPEPRPHTQPQIHTQTHPYTQPKPHTQPRSHTQPEPSSSRWARPPPGFLPELEPSPYLPPPQSVGSNPSSYSLNGHRASVSSNRTPSSSSTGQPVLVREITKGRQWTDHNGSPNASRRNDGSLDNNHDSIQAYHRPSHPSAQYQRSPNVDELEMMSRIQQAASGRQLSLPRPTQNHQPPIHAPVPQKYSARENIIAGEHQNGFDELSAKIEEDCEGFVNNVKENLKSILGYYFPTNRSHGDAFLERIGRGLIELGWQLTNDADTAMVGPERPTDPAEIRVDTREMRDAGDAGNLRDRRYPRDIRDARDAREVGDGRDGRDGRDGGHVGDARDTRDVRDMRIVGERGDHDPRSGGGQRGYERSRDLRRVDQGIL